MAVLLTCGSSAPCGRMSWPPSSARRAGRALGRGALAIENIRDEVNRARTARLNRDMDTDTAKLAVTRVALLCPASGVSLCSAGGAHERRAAAACTIANGLAKGENGLVTPIAGG